MKIKNVTFGNKIPVARCMVKNYFNNEFENATIYEYDCKSKLDVSEVNDIGGDWLFKTSIAREMLLKYYCLQNQGYPQKKSNKFYSIESEAGETLGLAETDKSKVGRSLIYLEKASNKNYKYAGQNLLAAIGIMAQKDNEKLNIQSPLTSSLDFYTKKCGFSEFKNYEYRYLTISDEDLEKFINKTKNLTNLDVIL